MTPVLNQVDVQNVLVAARRALAALAGADLVNVSTSIANIEAAYASPKPLTEKPEKADG